jgi:hypothetical protein
MRITATMLFVVTLCIAGCGDESGAAGPVGDWVVDLDHFAENMKAQGMPDAQVAQAKEKVQVLWRVKADGTWTTTGSMMGGPIDDAGTWKLQGADMTVTWTKKGGEASSDSLETRFTDAAIEIKPDEEMPFALRMIRK